MQFSSTLTHSSRTGSTRTVSPDRLGEFIREDISRNAPRVRDVGESFVTQLQGSKSLWPSRGHTRNFGPYSQGRSVRHFRVGGQSRSAGGQFGRVQLRNNAQNKGGRYYAGYVDQGIGRFGNTVSPSRYRLNYKAVKRTWDLYRGEVLRRAVRNRSRYGR